MPTASPPPVLSLRGVTKRFGSVEALSDVDVDFAAGEIHAILGENGAGKSTLMHVIYGLIATDAGSISIDGEPVRFRSPIDARRHRIGMVHQEFALIDALSVAENLAIALDTAGGWVLHRERVAHEALRMAHSVGLQIGDPSTPVGELPVGVRQRIEIIKALAGNTRILILDEPTAVLTPSEVAQLFRVLTELRARGNTVLFITHKLREVVAIADRVTVLRRGRVVVSLAAADTTVQQLAEYMVGTLPAPPDRVRHAVADADVPVLGIADLRVDDDRGLTAVENLALTLRAGETLGIAGVDGNGQWELFQVLAGLRPPRDGRIEIDGWPVTAFAPGAMIAAGLGYVPPDRRRHGAILEMSIADNALLNVALLRRLSRGLFLDPTRARRLASDIVERYGVRTASLDAPAASLSGGNLQRLIVGRTLEATPRVLIAFNPTRGLDITAAQAVYAALDRAQSQGTAVLLISTDLDEIIEQSDRVAVLYRGQLSHVYPRPFPSTRIAALMTGEA